MSQETPQKLKIVYRSAEQNQDDVCRKMDSSIAKTMPFSKSFVSEDPTGTYRGSASILRMNETTAIPAKMSGMSSKPHEGILQTQTNSKTQNQVFASVTSELKEPAAVWEGPLSRYNAYPSKKTPADCVEVLEKALHNLEQENLVDWEMEGYQAYGRMYQQLDMSEYMIQVYQRRDGEFQSVIEIRRSGGDSFVHDEWNRKMLKLLEDNQTLERKHDEEEEEVDFGFSFTSALPPLPLESSLWKESATSSSSEEEEMSDNDGIGDSEKNDLSIQHMADELVDVVTDRSSYQDIFRHSSGILCQELESNTQLMLYVLNKVDIIKKFIAPLLDGFYDTLIIRNMLQAVKILLKQEKQKVVVYENCRKDIFKLKETWNKSVQHNSINIRFGRSQQVEKLCSECLELLEKRL